MRKLVLTLALALAALLVPGLSLAETTEAPKTLELSLEQILRGESCPTETALWAPPGGCSRTCKVDRDCPYYPEQVCVSGCCAF